MCSQKNTFRSGRSSSVFGARSDANKVSRASNAIHMIKERGERGRYVSAAKDIKRNKGRTVSFHPDKMSLTSLVPAMNYGLGFEERTSSSSSNDAAESNLWHAAHTRLKVCRAGLHREWNRLWSLVTHAILLLVFWGQQVSAALPAT